MLDTEAPTGRRTERALRPRAHRATRAAIHFVVPIRSFTDAKLRLAQRLDAAGRADLARRMAERVVGAATGPITIVSSASEVVRWAHGHGFDQCEDPGSLDGAASAGLRHAHDAGARRVIVAHGDLPLVTSFEMVVQARGDVVVVPDRREDGTPVLAVPAASQFPFEYGPGSFRRHCASAAELGMSLQVVRDPTLRFDVDVPADLDDLDDLADLADTGMPGSAIAPADAPTA